MVACVSERETRCAVVGATAPVMSSTGFVVCVICGTSFNLLQPVWILAFTLQTVAAFMHAYCYIALENSVFVRILRITAAVGFGLYLHAAYLFYPMWCSFCTVSPVYAIANGAVFAVGFLIAVYIAIRSGRKRFPYES